MDKQAYIIDVYNQNKNRFNILYLLYKGDFKPKYLRCHIFLIWSPSLFCKVVWIFVSNKTRKREMQEQK